MAKRKAEETPEAVEAAPAGETITKTEAVKRALAAGKDQPKDAVGWIKEQYGLDMTTQQFSTAKFQANKKAGGEPKGKPGRKPRAAAAVPASDGDTVGNGRSSSNPAELARAVKSLVGQYGADAVRDMTAVFAE